MMQKYALSKVFGIATLVVAGSVVGCAGEAAAPRSPTFASEAPYLESDIPPASTPTPTPRAEVTSVVGLDSVRARREFRAVANRLRACPNVEKVPIRVQVKSEDGRTHIAFVDEAPQKLSGDGRRCVLDAMSTVDVDDIASGASPSNRPSGFTANVLLSWF